MKFEFEIQGDYTHTHAQYAFRMSREVRALFPVQLIVFLLENDFKTTTTTTTRRSSNFREKRKTFRNINLQKVKKISSSL